jgi:hypothetical protein
VEPPAGIGHDNNGTPGRAALRQRPIYQEFLVSAPNGLHQPKLGNGYSEMRIIKSSPDFSEATYFHRVDARNRFNMGQGTGIAERLRVTG